jgi:hypothetical protein
MQLQEYDLQIEHISGANNFSADTLGRNPIGLSQESRDLVMKPTEVNLATDRTLINELGNLSKHQLRDPVLLKIREELASHPMKLQGKYMIRDNIL